MFEKKCGFVKLIYCASTCFLISAVSPVNKDRVPHKLLCLSSMSAAPVTPELRIKITVYTYPNPAGAT